ncbi:MAG: glycosidase [Anaerolineaceae bacterium]|jgi:4-O-beta-D-mannosyl-D-glucose phosphorylase|nr:glycosidase [Anaerolineaceae bacterium]
MKKTNFFERKANLISCHEELINRENLVDNSYSHGIFERYQYPVLTYEHVPLNWRFDFNPEDNPYLLERLRVNSVFNSGAIATDNGVILVARIEGSDRKSFFAIAESKTGIDQFRFWDEPIKIPETENPDVNIYDMRLTKHQDGWIYGVFSSERKDPEKRPGVLFQPFATAAIVRTKDFVTWERLPDLRTKSPQQRNVVLHPEFVNGRYAFYTRPQDAFMDAGLAEGIGWGLCEDITSANIEDEVIIDHREFNTIKSAKNGAGAPPIKTEIGWLHIAHAVRNTAVGLRYVLYLFVCDIEEPWRVIYQPGGYLIEPRNWERVGDVSNVLFSNGLVLKEDGTLLIYYSSSDTRLHVASTDLNRILDYAVNTPMDPLRSALCVEQRIKLIDKNRPYWNQT